MVDKLFPFLPSIKVLAISEKCNLINYISITLYSDD